MKTQLHIGDLVIQGDATRLLLAVTNKWFSQSRDATRFIPFQISRIAIAHAVRETPRSFSDFKKWVMVAKIDVTEAAFDEYKYEQMRIYLRSAHLLGDDIKITYTR